MTEPISPETADRIENKAPEVEIVDPSEVSSKVETGVVSMETSNGATDVIAGMEGNEIRETEKSVVTEDQSSSSSTAAHTSDKKAADKIRSQLDEIEAIPEAELRTKVKVSLAHEIHSLEKDVKKYKKNPTKYSHALAVAFQQLKDLRHVLRNIARAAIELLRSLYEKVLKKESLSGVEI